MQIATRISTYSHVAYTESIKSISEVSFQLYTFPNLTNNKKPKSIKKDVIQFDKREKNIPSLHENLIKRTQKIQAFFKNEYEDFQRALTEHNRRVREDENYDPVSESKYFKEKKLYTQSQYVILDEQIVRLDINEYIKHETLVQFPSDSKNYNWIYQSLIMTEQNKYENAPEFEAFVNKWMNKGFSEDEALERAKLYAQARLLDYGNQRAMQIEYLEYSDKKQHGLHLIQNEVLKKAILETFDSLDNNAVGILTYRLFMHDGELNPDASKDTESIVFQELINDFSSRLKEEGGLYALDDKKYSKYKNMQFDGNINITDKMSQHDKNFIHDILAEYLKEHLNKISQIEKIHNEAWTEAKDAINLLINNFEKNVKESNKNQNKQSAILEQYRRNTREQII